MKDKISFRKTLYKKDAILKSIEMFSYDICCEISEDDAYYILSIKSSTDGSILDDFNNYALINSI